MKIAELFGNADQNNKERKSIFVFCVSYLQASQYVIKE